VFVCRAGFHCPPNFNPADFFIQTLAIQPGSEEQCTVTMKKICDSFENGEGAREIQVMLMRKPRLMRNVVTINIFFYIAENNRRSNTSVQRVRYVATSGLHEN